jgi:hypothetical protein
MSTPRLGPGKRNMSLEGVELPKARRATTRMGGLGLLHSCCWMHLTCPVLQVTETLCTARAPVWES